MISLINSVLLFTFLNFGASVEAPKEEISWVNFEEAIEMNASEKRYIFIDLYTDWCGWCKKMDASTFKNQEVMTYMSANFYNVKFNAEQKENITYKDKTFKFVASGRNGIHELAYSLLDGKLTYPSFVILDKQEKRVTILKGFMDKNALLSKLKAVVK